MDNRFLAVAALVMAAAFVGGVCIGKGSLSNGDIIGMSESGFLRHQQKTAEQDMVRSLMLSEQRAQVRRNHRVENEISRQDKLDLIDIIKGVK